MVADQKVWADKMFQYADKMSVFERADLIEIEPVLRESVKKVVQVTHDECAFHANDSPRFVWFKEEMRIVRAECKLRSKFVLVDVVIKIACSQSFFFFQKKIKFRKI